MANKIVREIIHAKGIDIGIYTKDFENEYISLTDIAKYRNDNDPRFVIQNWMRNRNTVEFLAVWEELHNPDFNRVQFEAVRSEAGLNRFVMTPTKWIEQTNAIGIVSKAGRYGGGTYAHSDIAMAFATWISPEFQLYIMKDYRRLKQDENSRLSLDWNLNRALSKVNYRIHTDAVKEFLITPTLSPQEMAYTYASEADILNMALFGKTAAQWRNENREEAVRSGQLLLDAAFGTDCLKTSFQMLYSIINLPNINLGQLQIILAAAGLLSVLATVSCMLFLSAKCKDTLTVLLISIVVLLMPLFAYVAMGATWLSTILPSAGIGMQNNFLSQLANFNYLNIGGMSFWTPHVILISAGIELFVFTFLAIHSYCRHQVA